MDLNLTNEEFVKIQSWLIEKEERDNILGDVEPFDITGW